MAYDNPRETILQEAEEVGSLLETLAAMGITCPEMIDASIESQTNFKEIIESQLRASGEVEAMIDGIDEYVKTLGARKKRFEKMVDTIRDNIALALERSNQPKIITGFGTVTTAKGSIRMEVTNEADVPEMFFEPKVNTADLKSAMVAWKKQHDAIMETKDEAERKKLLTAFLRKNPPIKGAQLIEGKRTLKITRK
jgi:hypothetical protein